MSNNKLPIVLGLGGIGLITLVGGLWYVRTTGKEWLQASQDYDEASERESREKQARLTEELEKYDPRYADDESLFGSSSSDEEEARISDLFEMHGNDRDSFSDEKGGSRKNRKAKKNVSKRKRREKKVHHTKKHNKRNRTKRHKK